MEEVKEMLCSEKEYESISDMCKNISYRAKDLLEIGGMPRKSSNKIKIDLEDAIIRFTHPAEDCLWSYEGYISGEDSWREGAIHIIRNVIAEFAKYVFVDEGRELYFIRNINRLLGMYSEEQ